MNIRRTLTAAAVASTAATLLAFPATAESVKAKVDLTSWDYEGLYAEGFSATRFMDAEVYGAKGDVVGEIEDLVVSPEGKVTHAIVETDAFLDLGDKHVQYPMEKIEVQSTDAVTVPFDEGRLEEYTLFPDVDDEAIPGRRWRISELIGDYAYLEEKRAYGYVEDVIVTEDGEVASVVVHPDVTYAETAYGGGPYALPWYGYDSPYGFDPGVDTYDLPYTAEDLPTVEPFDTDRLEGTPNGAGTS